MRTANRRRIFRKRWLKVSLRFCLLLIAVFAVGFCWIDQVAREHLSEQRIVQELDASRHHRRTRPVLAETDAFWKGCPTLTAYG